MQVTKLSISSKKEEKQRTKRINRSSREISKKIEESIAQGKLMGN